MTLTLAQDAVQTVTTDSAHWEYRSRRYSTDDGHTVRVIGDDVHDCTCNDFFLTDTCCHANAVLSQLAADEESIRHWEEWRASEEAERAEHDTPPENIGQTDEF